MNLKKFVIELSGKNFINETPQSRGSGFSSENKQILEQEKRLFLKSNFQSITIRSSALLEIYKKLLKENKITANKFLENALQLKNIRSSSGVSVVTVLTKPWPCPGKCVYCPTADNMPKSYLASEPAAQRALQNDFDPYAQVQSRLTQYQNTGHLTNKIELIVLGGSFNAYPKTYQKWFVNECFRAANDFGSTNFVRGGLEVQQSANENANSRIVFLSVETRPDLITVKEALWFRKLGVTKVELGVQSLDDKVLKICNRGHTVAETAKATKILKSMGFKICYHIMPNLPGATITCDLVDFQKLFSNPCFQPDMLKIYPCVVLPGTKLFDWFQSSKYIPYSQKELIGLLVDMKKIVPPYVRINRIIRDIPEFEIVGGNKVTNLRQVVAEELEDRKVSCQCIRCREIRNRKGEGKVRLAKIEYQSRAGLEIFLQFIDGRDNLYGLLRLLLPSKETVPFLKGSALVRELHIFGEEMAVGKKAVGAIQHKGLGQKLLKEAERLATVAGYIKLAVIAGVGVRGYYRKLGYRLVNSYMVKFI